MNKSLLAYSHWISELLASGFTYSPSQFKCTFFFYNSWWFLLKYHQFYNIVLFCSSGEKVDLLYSFRINEFVISTGFSQTCKKPYFQVAFLCTVLGSHWHPWNCVFQQTRRKHLIVKYVTAPNIVKRKIKPTTSFRLKGREKVSACTILIVNLKKQIEMSVDNN